VVRATRRRGAALSLRSSAWVLAFLLCAAGSAGASGGARGGRADPARGGRRLTLGTQTLTRCAASPLTFCGRLSVALDRAAPAGPSITVAFRWYPATDTRLPARGTGVPVEGGPGYPTIGSVDAYRAMYGPLLSRWNLLAVDNRGTGASTVLDCPALQNFSGPTGTAAFQRVVAACGRALNHRWRDRDGRWVNASDLFDTSAAAGDLAAVIDALQVGKVDLYGDSYGSWFAQVFASRFPGLTRSVTLDSTYQTRGLDPWYRATIRSMPAAFDAVCRRSAACRAAAPGSSWSRLTRLATDLAHRALSAEVPGATGSLARVRMNAVGLVDLLNDAAEDPLIYQEIDAAARAYLEDHDPAPLLRLYAQRLAADEAYFGIPAAEYSVELYLAVSCVDYPQLFDMTSPPSVRAAELDRAVARLSRSAFSPFSVSDWIDQDQNTETYSACLRWPAIAGAQRAFVTPLPRSIPVLVLAGQLDTWTPPAGAVSVLAQIGGHGRFIELVNATHVVGEGDTVCGSTLVREFVADPQAIGSLDAWCAAAVPDLHAVGAYPDSLSAQAPLRPVAPGTATHAQRELAAAAVGTAGDAIARFEAIGFTTDHGLRGGRVRAARGGRRLVLTGDQLVAGIAVSGTVDLAPALDPVDGQTVRATLTARTSTMAPVRLVASWSTAGADARAVVSGSAGDRRVSGTMPAP
jgi:pimeloyl-ACP methyl ester carboxylesterase